MQIENDSIRLVAREEEIINLEQQLKESEKKAKGFKVKGFFAGLVSGGIFIWLVKN